MGRFVEGDGVLRMSMNKQEIIAKLEDIEWEDFEVKEAKSEVPKSSWESVSAFSNTAGGWLVFGVRKNGKQYEILGVRNPEKMEHDFIATLRSGDKFNKIIDVKPKKYNLDDKTILAFYIPQKSPRDKPVYFNSIKNTFIRSGSGDQRATPEEIDSFYRLASFEEKDKEATNRASSDLDKNTIQKFRNYFNTVNPGHRYNGLSNEEFLDRLGVLKDGKVTYGGLLVFGSEEALSEELVNYRIEYLEIQGTSYEDAPSRYSFRISSDKNLFETFFEIYERLSRKVEVPFSIAGGIRNDDPVHLQAIREALINLLIHTDYFSNGNARIRVFVDRFEFFNPGALPKKIELILKEDFSQPRNPIIAKIFRFVKFSENIGSGFHKMFQGWKQHYGATPIVKGDFDWYKITFPFNRSIATNKTTDKSDKEKELLDMIRNNPHLTVEELGGLLELTKEGVKYHINKLRKKGGITREGSKKTGRWIAK